MSHEDGEAEKRDVWGSVEGLIKEGSLMRDEKGLSVIVIGDNQAEFLVRGDGDRFSGMIETATEAGAPVIFQGHLLGSPEEGSAHLDLRIAGPIELTGPVSEIIRSGEAGPPYVGFWMLREIPSTEGVTHRIGTGVNVYGADADALSGLREGDRVRLQARHGPDGFVATSPVTVLAEDEPDGPAM